MRLLSKTFRSIKPPLSKQSSSSDPDQPSLFISRLTPEKSTSNSISSSRSWCVYLILSTTAPIKTYVGATVDFSRRLKQHNGELGGGAKASRTGRPWVCACIIRGFSCQSEACKFESKWKSLSRKLPRNGKNVDTVGRSVDKSHALLQHRHKALSRVQGLINCNEIEIEWKIDPQLHCKIISKEDPDTKSG